jgi:proteic killer suppression protein
MILGFRHKGLRLLFENGDRRKVQPEYAEKLERILARLDEADEAEDMDLPGYRLHRLKGDLAGLWSITVSGNWRLVFRFNDGDADEVDLVDHY